MVTAHSQKSAQPLLLAHFPVQGQVDSNEHPPWSELCVEFEKPSLKRFAHLR